MGERCTRGRLRCLDLGAIGEGLRHVGEDDVQPSGDDALVLGQVDVA